MNKNLFSLIAFITAIAFFNGTAFAQENATDTEKQLRELRTLINQLKNELKNVKGQKGSLEKQLQDSEVDIGELLKKIDKLKGQLNDQQTKLKSLQKERQQLQLARRQQQHLIKQDINTAYRMGRQSHLKQVLNQQDPATLSRQLRYYDYFLTARADNIESYLHTIGELDRVEPAIAQKESQLKVSKRDLEKRFNRLQNRQQERKQTLARLQKLITDKDVELQQQEQNSKRLSKLLQKLNNAIANLQIDSATPFPKRKGKLPWPLKGPVWRNFGTPRIGQLKWDGMVIKAREGAKVKAVHHGRIVFADYLRGYGLLTIIDHGDGYLSLYGRNQTLLKDMGDWVSTNDVIATAGNTGGQQYSSLYFEIRRKGKPSNPKRWLARR
ncbi:MAG: peptidoglycan DD-metalloendopeptidase family protein [Cellvibrionaceae bacterium]